MPSVFLSYSHKDEVWKDRLKTHLGALDLEALPPWKPEVRLPERIARLRAGA